MNLLGFGFLCCAAVEDWKNQELEMIRLIVFGAVALVLRIVYLRSTWYEVAEAMLLGLLVLFLALITQEAIGYGDGVVILIMGLFCGLHSTLYTCLGAFFVMLICSIVYSIRYGICSNQRVPFVPCLLLGFIGGVLW